VGKKPPTTPVFAAAWALWLSHPAKFLAVLLTLTARGVGSAGGDGAWAVRGAAAREDALLVGGLWRFGFEGESGLGEEPADERRLVLDALEPVPDDGGQLVDVRAARLPRPFFMFAHTPSGG
jgi:hypothetical protein